MVDSEAIQDSTHVDRLLRARDVMDRLGVSRPTAYRMMADGTLPVIRFGRGKHGPRTVRVRESRLLEWLNSQESGGATKSTEG